MVTTDCAWIWSIISRGPDLLWAPTVPTLTMQRKAHNQNLIISLYKETSRHWSFILTNWLFPHLFKAVPLKYTYQMSGILKKGPPPPKFAPSSRLMDNERVPLSFFFKKKGLKVLQPLIHDWKIKSWNCWHVTKACQNNHHIYQKKIYMPL